MTTAYTSLLGLALPVQGELNGTWGDMVDNAITSVLDVAVAGTQTISGSQTAVTLSVTNGNSSATNLAQVGSGTTGSAQYAIINCTGNPASLLTITVPASSRQYTVINATSTSQSVKIVGAGPTTGVTIVSGEKATVSWNGSDFVKVSSSAAGDVTASGNNAFTGANTFYNATGQSFAPASTNDGIIIKGRAGGTSSYRVTFAPTTLTASRSATFPNADTVIPVATQTLTFSGPTAARTVTLPDANFSAGYLNIPASADKTGSYSLATTDVGKVISIGTGGAITVPDATFSAGDAVLLFNNTSSPVTITMSITTAYIAGTDADKATITLATRGIANILFVSGTICTVTGNVS